MGIESRVHTKNKVKRPERTCKKSPQTWGLKDTFFNLFLLKFLPCKKSPQTWGLKDTLFFYIHGHYAFLQKESPDMGIESLVHQETPQRPLNVLQKESPDMGIESYNILLARKPEPPLLAKRVPRHGD